MKKVVVLIEIMAFSMLFQNCTSSTEDKVAENTTIENIVQEEGDALETTNVSETNENAIIVEENEASVIKDEVKSVASTPPKTTTPKANQPEIKDETPPVVETPVTEVKEDPTPPVEEPKPDPVVTTNVVETPTPTPPPTTTTTPPHWVIPAKYKTMANPMKSNGSEEGKDIWTRECKSCHGTKGLGDGPKASKIDISCGDFSSKKFQAFTDGEIYYITSSGRKPMPSYKEKLSEDEIWLVVNYIRTLKK